MDFINLSRQRELIQKNLDRRISKVLDQGKYIMGPEVLELETSLSEFTGSKYCISCANGTDALQLAIMSVDIKPGDEVITTSFSFVAASEVISLLGARPVFVDIDETFNIRADQVKLAITENTKAIIPVSLYGQTADMETINSIADQYGITVIEDGAQSFGAKFKQKMSGNLSKLACTSFFPSKVLGCYGDGGAVFTSDELLAQKIRSLRTHGQKIKYKQDYLGINSRLDTIQAAILLEKLSLLPEELKARKAIADIYNRELKDFVHIPVVGNDRSHVYAQYTITTPQRDRLQAFLKGKDIPTGVYYPIPLHLQKTHAHNSKIIGSLPFTLEACETVLSLPMSPYLLHDEQNAVIEGIKEFFQLETSHR